MSRRDDERSRTTVEQRTRRWIESRYLKLVKPLANEGGRVWNEDGQPRRLTGHCFQDIQRKLKIFSWLDRIEFDSFLDFGSGFDLFPKLVGERYGVPAYFSDFVHFMNLPYGAMLSPKLDHAVTLNGIRLPFADDAFDVVLASEVLEHLVRPVETIAELLRISRKFVIMTSLEALSPNLWERRLSHFHVDVRREHVERNFFVLSELDALFGPLWHRENLFYDPNLPASIFAPEDEQRIAYRALRDIDQLSEALCRAVEVRDLTPGSMGILLVEAQGDARVPSGEAETDFGLARWLIEQAATTEKIGISVASQFADGTIPLPERDRPVAAPLLALLRCPDCRGLLEQVGSGLRCEQCAVEFPCDYGVPMLYPTCLERAESEDECLDRICDGDSRRRTQVKATMRRLRRNERPAGPLRRLAWRMTRRLGVAPAENLAGNIHEF